MRVPADIPLVKTVCDLNLNRCHPLFSATVTVSRGVQYRLLRSGLADKGNVAYFSVFCKGFTKILQVFPCQLKIATRFFPMQLEVAGQIG